MLRRSRLVGQAATFPGGALAVVNRLVHSLSHGQSLGRCICTLRVKRSGIRGDSVIWNPFPHFPGTIKFPDDLLPGCSVNFFIVIHSPRHQTEC